jgi:hypothetical protein
MPDANFGQDLKHPDLYSILSTRSPPHDSDLSFIDSTESHYVSLLASTSTHTLSAFPNIVHRNISNISNIQGRIPDFGHMCHSRSVRQWSSVRQTCGE